MVSNTIGLMPARSFISAAFSLLFFLVPSLQAAEVQWPAKFGSWTATTPGSRTVAEMNTSATEMKKPFMKEAGLVSITARTFAQAENRATFTLYTFHDSSGAYEALTVIGAPVIPDGERAFVRTICRSNLVLHVSSDSDVGPEALDAAAKWLQSNSDGVASPPIANYMPDRDREPGTDRYALGPVAFRWAMELLGPQAAGLVDVAGFNSGAEAMLAKYKAGRDGATLLLIDYPTPQLAELHLRHLQRALVDAKWGTSSVERKGSLLSIVLAPTSAEYAEKLRGAVNYETQVTWNEPSATATDPPIMSTLVKIFIATGVFMVLTVVVGIAFGGVRVITKRLFPGKVFDRPQQIEVLQLGLSSKPIDPSDLY